MGEATTLLYGRVIGQRRTGTYVKGAKVGIYEDGREMLFAVTESDGYFEIKNVPIST